MKKTYVQEVGEKSPGSLADIAGNGSITIFAKKSNRIITKMKYNACERNILCIF